MEEKITKGKYVELMYDLYEIEGNDEVLVYEGNAEDPEKIIFGITPLMRPFEGGIDGLKVGDRFEVKVGADEAFGQYNPEMVITVEKTAFGENGEIDREKIYPGAFLPMLTADGMTVNGLVKEITNDGVVMDFNHPSAGKEMFFKGEILAVRDATEEEIAAATKACSCGHCGDGGCGSSCGEGCGA